MIKNAPTAIDEKVALPNTIQLFQNYPNPVSVATGKTTGTQPYTNIHYTISEPGEVKLQVFNIIGQEIVTLADGWHNVGNYTKQFKVTGQPAGLYFYRLEAKNAIAIKKMILK